VVVIVFRSSSETQHERKTAIDLVKAMPKRLGDLRGAAGISFARPSTRSAVHSEVAEGRARDFRAVLLEQAVLKRAEFER
jgi:hypothetical protein